MQMKSMSYFESRFAKESLAETQGYRDYTLAESASFVALPTIGAIVPGWILIAPKTHCLALAALDDETLRELWHFESEVRSLVEYEFGEVAIFEHGPSKPSSLVGCGVDHAHLHIVPIQLDLLAEASRLYPHIKWEAIDDLSAASEHHKAGRSYLYFRQPNVRNEHFLATSSDGFSSQLFRRVIANGAGLHDQWDWKAFPQVNNMEATCKRMAAPPPLIA
jgi:ATP adenylyltransferase